MFQILRPGPARPGGEPSLIQPHYVIQTKHLILSSSPLCLIEQTASPPSLCIRVHAWLWDHFSEERRGGNAGDKGQMEEDAIDARDGGQNEIEKHEVGEEGRGKQRTEGEYEELKVDREPRRNETE